MNKPSNCDHASVVTFIENDQPLMEKDRKFIYEKEDLVAIKGGRENAWLDAAVESVLRWYPCKPIKASPLHSTLSEPRLTISPDALLL